MWQFWRAVHASDRREEKKKKKKKKEKKTPREVQAEAQTQVQWAKGGPTATRPPNRQLPAHANPAPCPVGEAALQLDPQGTPPHDWAAQSGAHRNTPLPLRR